MRAGSWIALALVAGGLWWTLRTKAPVVSPSRPDAEECLPLREQARSPVHPSTTADDAEVETPTRADPKREEVPPEPKSNDARLLVRVVDEGETPIAGAWVTPVGLTLDYLWHSPKTDEDGRTELTLPSGQAFAIYVFEEEGRFEAIDVEVEALHPGEIRRIMISVEILPSSIVHGRVVAEEDGAPIFGAEVRLRSGIEPFEFPSTTEPCPPAGSRFAMTDRASTLASPSS